MGGRGLDVCGAVQMAGCWHDNERSGFMKYEVFDLLSQC